MCFMTRVSDDQYSRLLSACRRVPRIGPGYDGVEVFAAAGTLDVCWIVLPDGS